MGERCGRGIGEACARTSDTASDQHARARAHKNKSNPITSLTFSEVRVKSRSTWFFIPSLRPWGYDYHCENAQGRAFSSYPAPSCLVDYGRYMQASVTVLALATMVGLLIGAFP